METQFEDPNLNHPNNDAILSIGTHVSAKYKGAFCQAKIIKVEEKLSIRIFFHKTKSSFLLTPQDLKTYGKSIHWKEGSEISAKHPQQGKFMTGKVVKVIDNSLYTVSFDDGDEKIMKRTALVLMGQRHFVNEQTFNNVPLEDPEKFSAPVIPSRARFSPKQLASTNISTSTPPKMASLVENSDAIKHEPKITDPASRVCVYVDSLEATEEYWWPAITVPQQEIESYMGKPSLSSRVVKFFQDSTFSVVEFKDMRLFDRKSNLFIQYCKKFTKYESISSVKKALAFIEKNILPINFRWPLWSVVAPPQKVSHLEAQTPPSAATANQSFSPGQRASIQDPKKKKIFFSKLSKYFETKGKSSDFCKNLSLQIPDLFDIYRLVIQNGGLSSTQKSGFWKTIFALFEAPATLIHSSPSSPLLSPHALKTSFDIHLKSFLQDHQDPSIFLTSPPPSTTSGFHPCFDKKQSLSPDSSCSINPLPSFKLDSPSSPPPSPPLLAAGSTLSNPNLSTSNPNVSTSGMNPQKPLKGFKYAVGDIIRCISSYDGLPYDAKIVRAELMNGSRNKFGPNYQVHYPGWNSRYDEWVSESNVVGAGGTPHKTTLSGKYLTDSPSSHPSGQNQPRDEKPTPGRKNTSIPQRKRCVSENITSNRVAKSARRRKISEGNSDSAMMDSTFLLDATIHDNHHHHLQHSHEGRKEALMEEPLVEEKLLPKSETASDASTHDPQIIKEENITMDPLPISSFPSSDSSLKHHLCPLDQHIHSSLQNIAHIPPQTLTTASSSASSSSSSETVSNQLCSRVTNSSSSPPRHQTSSAVVSSPKIVVVEASFDSDPSWQETSAAASMSDMKKVSPNSKPKRNLIVPKKLSKKKSPLKFVPASFDDETSSTTVNIHKTLQYSTSEQMEIRLDELRLEYQKWKCLLENLKKRKKN